MCTVSIVPHRDGFRLMSNRDERRDRAVALDPRVESLGSRSVIVPDPVGGVSWIGVNDAGLAAAVLNRHHRPTQLTARLMSRAAIVRQALGSESVGAALESVLALEAARFQPFRLVLVQKRQIALVAGDAREFVHARSALEQPCTFTASSLGDVLVDTPRRRLFECLMDHPGDRLRGQLLFHRRQWTNKRDISVLIEREDAATVSRTTVDVGEDGIALEYESLLPRRPVRRLALPPC